PGRTWRRRTSSGSSRSLSTSPWWLRCLRRVVSGSCGRFASTPWRSSSGRVRRRKPECGTATRSLPWRRPRTRSRSAARTRRRARALEAADVLREAGDGCGEALALLAAVRSGAVQLAPRAVEAARRTQDPVVHATALQVLAATEELDAGPAALAHAAEAIPVAD